LAVGRTTLRAAAAAVLGALRLLPGATRAQTGNPTHDAAAARGEQARQTEFLRARRGEGSAGPGVAVTFFAGFGAARIPAWEVRCQGDEAYRIVLPASASRGRRCAPAGRSRAAPFPSSPPHLHGGAAAGSDLPRGPKQPAGGGALRLHVALPLGRRRRSGRRASPPARAAARFARPIRRPPPSVRQRRDDRLAVNLSAVRACQQGAGPLRCQFRQEIVSAWGFLLARGAWIGALMMTEDLATQRLARASAATAPPQGKAAAAGGHHAL
jgi:hypothetical protein